MNQKFLAVKFITIRLVKGKGSEKKREGEEGEGRGEGNRKGGGRGLQEGKSNF